MRTRILAADWSGAKQSSRRKIWLAEADAETGTLLTLEDGRDRHQLADQLLREAERTPDLIVGLDFAFSFPAWFLDSRGWNTAAEVWEAADQDGEGWLAECRWPFWGRSGRRKPRDVPGEFRQTELEIPAINGIRPKSVFQIGGVGAVGTGSIRGMPILRRLRENGFAVWPFDRVKPPAVIEIYPRLLTVHGAVQIDPLGVPCEACRGRTRVGTDPSRLQRSSLRRYLQGLLGDSPRESMQAMLARVTDPGHYQTFQHFITHAT